MRLLAFLVGCIAITLSTTVVDAAATSVSWLDAKRSLSSIKAKHDARLAASSEARSAWFSKAATRHSAPHFATLEDAPFDLEAAVTDMKTTTHENGAQTLDFSIGTFTTQVEPIDVIFEASFPSSLVFSAPSCDSVFEGPMCLTSAPYGVRYSFSALPNPADDASYSPVSIPIISIGNEHLAGPWMFKWVLSTSGANPVGGQMEFNNLSMGGMSVQTTSVTIPAGHGSMTTNSEKTFFSVFYDLTNNMAPMSIDENSPTGSGTIMSPDKEVDGFSLEFDAYGNTFDSVPWQCSGSVVRMDGSSWIFRSSERSHANGLTLHLHKPVMEDKIAGIYVECTTPRTVDFNYMRVPSVSLVSSVFGTTSLLYSFSSFNDFNSEPRAIFPIVLATRSPLQVGSTPDIAAIQSLLEGDVSEIASHFSLFTVTADGAELPAMTLALGFVGSSPLLQAASRNIGLLLMSNNVGLVPGDAPEGVTEFQAYVGVAGYYGFAVGEEDNETLVPCGTVAASRCFLPNELAPADHANRGFSVAYNNTLPCFFKDIPTEDVTCTLPLSIPDSRDADNLSHGDVRSQIVVRHYDPTNAFTGRDYTMLATFPDGMLQNRTLNPSCEARTETGNQILTCAILGNTLRIPVTSVVIERTPTEPVTTTLYEIWFHTNAVIQGDFKVTVDIVGPTDPEDVSSTADTSSFLLNAPYIHTSYNLNLVDMSSSATSSISQQGGVLTIGVTNFKSEDTNEPSYFRVAGPDGSSVPNCTVYVAVMPNSDEYMLAPYLTMDADSEHPGFTKLLRNTDAGLDGFPATDYWIVTCPATFPEGSTVKLYVLQSPMLAAMSSGAPKVSRSVQPTDSMKTLDEPEFPDSQRGIALLVSGTVDDASEEQSEYCHRSEFHATYKYLPPMPTSSKFATMSATAKDAKDIEAKAETFSAAAYNNNGFPSEDDESIHKMLRQGLMAVFNMTRSSSDNDTYFYRNGDTIIARTCSAPTVAYSKPEYNVNSLPSAFATQAFVDPDTLPNPEFWKLSVNAAVRMAMSSDALAARLGIMAFDRTFRDNYSRKIALSLKQTEGATSSVSVPKSEIDYKCSDATTGTATRENCVFETCSRDWANPEECFYGNRVVGRDEECVPYGERNEPVVTGCDWYARDVPFSIQFINVNTSILTFKMVPVTPKDFMLADHIVISFAGFPTDDMSASVERAGSDGVFTLVTYNTSFANNAFSLIIADPDTFTDTYRVIFTDPNGNAFSNADLIKRSTRSLYINSHDASEEPVFNSSKAFTSRAGTAYTVDGGDTFTLIGTTGSLSFVPNLYKYEAHVPASELTDCRATRYPDVLSGMSSLFPSSWPDANIASGVDPNTSDKVVSFSDTASEFGGAAFRCAGSWAPADEPARGPVLPAFFAARSADDGLFYGGHTASIDEYDSAETRVFHGTVSTPAFTDAVTEALTEAVPQWIAADFKIVGVTSPGANGTRAIAIQVSKARQMLFPTARAFYEVVHTFLATSFSHVTGAPAYSTLALDYLDDSEAGQWGCEGSVPTVFNGPCSAANDCAATYSSTQGCQTSTDGFEVSSLEANINCAFAAPLPTTLPVTSGCGAYLCAGAEANTFVECPNSPACTDACAVDVELTPAVIDSIDALKPICVKGGASVDADDFCPPDLVDAATYATHCNATSACGAVCTNSKGRITNCADGNAWSACSATCGPGTQTISLRCANSKFAINNPAGPAVPPSFCGWTGDAPAGLETERACELKPCPPAYMCRPANADSAASPMPCDNDAFEAQCPTTGCEQPTMYREVVCVEAGVIVDDSVCVAAKAGRAPAPSFVCPAVTSECSAVIDPAAPCADTDGTKYACADESTPLLFRKGTCFDKANSPVNDEWCDAAEMSESCSIDACTTPGKPSITVTVTKGPGANNYSIRWTVPSSVAADATANVAIVVNADAKQGGGISTFLGTPLASDKVLVFNAADREIAPASYNAVVVIKPIAPGTSKPFDVVPACVASPCANDGECVPSTGRCECIGEWSGPSCATSPCDTKGCNPNGSTCSVSSAGDAVCGCSEAFTGPRCTTPAQGCDASLPACANGGVRGGLVEVGSTTAECADCVCENSWTAESNCVDCGFMCFNEGVANDACNGCQCKINGGYHGEHCHCRHVYMTFVVLATKIPFSVPGVIDSDTRKTLFATFAASFASDLKRAIGAAKVNADMDAFTESVSGKGVRSFAFSFWVGPQCPAVPAAGSSGAVADADMIPSYTGIAALKKTLDVDNHLTTPALGLMDMESGFDAHDPNCQLGNECPSGWRRGGKYTDDTPGGHDTEPGSGSKLSDGAIIGIAVGGSIFLLILIGVLVAACCGFLCFAGRKKLGGGGNSATEMSSV